MVDGRVEYDGPAMTESGPLLDLDALLESVGGDRELLDELAATFIAEVPGWIASLRAALESGQPETVFRVAHGVSGAVGYFRAAGVRKRAVDRGPLATLSKGNAPARLFRPHASFLPDPDPGAQVLLNGDEIFPAMQPVLLPAPAAAARPAVGAS